MNLHLLTLNFPQAPCWCVSFGVVTAFSLHFVWGKNCSSKCRKRFLIGENDKRHLKPYIPQGGSRFSEKQLKHQFTGTSTEPEILACEALFWRKLRAKTSSELHGVLFKCTVGVIAVTSPQSKLLFFVHSFLHFLLGLQSLNPVMIHMCFLRTWLAFRCYTNISHYKIYVKNKAFCLSKNLRKLMNL